MIQNVPIGDLRQDPNNPRETIDARFKLLLLSLSKLGFVLPLYALPDGFLLSGHQRIKAAQQLGFTTVPVEYVDLPEKDVRGINIVLNRTTNDLTILQTGGNVFHQLDIRELLEQAEKVPDYPNESWAVMRTVDMDIRGLGKQYADMYDKKSIVAANNLLRKNIRMPIVLSESGDIVNGLHRLLAAREEGIETWPVVTIPDNRAELAHSFMNAVSMDYKVDAELQRVLRYSAYRRPQNARGQLAKAYRFWANGERTLPDKDSYSVQYWRKFRDLHGPDIIDFGAGLGKVAPLLNRKGMNCLDFEPLRIRPGAERQVPDSAYSRRKAREFLQSISDGTKYNSIFLASVLNSIPFPEDRMKVLAIVHALCSIDTVVYGTVRDISDYTYVYDGIRQANYFVFDSEHGVRLGDALSNPKIQKFHTQEELAEMTKHFWNDLQQWRGGNIRYFRARYPKRPNPNILRQSLIFEFHEFPFKDSQMWLGDLAIECFNKRLGFKMPPLSAEEKEGMPAPRKRRSI